MLFITSLRFSDSAARSEIFPESNNTTIFPEPKEAVVERPIFPSRRGSIRSGGVFYRAEIYSFNGGIHSRALRSGQRVRMVGIRENVALVVA